MILKPTFLPRQKGVVLVLVALSLVVLMGVAALAIDMSHAEVNKTRLQNLTDALALSAAISLNKQESSTTVSSGDKEAYAEYYAKNTTLPAFKASLGNYELTALAAAHFTFTFAADYSTTAGNWYAATAINDAKFARVEVTTPMSVKTWFANIMGFSDMAVSNSAVAGTTPVAPCDNTLPVLACAANGNTDTDCSDGACYGYATNAVFCLKTDATGSGCPDVPSAYTGLISGNFGWMDVGTGGHSVNDCAAGDPACAETFCANYVASGTLSSQPGNVSAIAQGFNTRFDDYKGAYKSPSTGTAYYPDRIVGGNPSLSTVADNSTRSDGSTLNPAGPIVTVQTISATATPTNLYKNYYKPLVDNNSTSDAKPVDLPKDGRRVLAMPFIDCNSVTKGGGTFTVPASGVIGFGCVFITQPMSSGGAGNIYLEVIDNSNNACIAAGKTISTGNTGIYKVILYKDPLGYNPS